MAKRGQRAKPRELRVIEGNKGKRPLPPEHNQNGRPRKYVKFTSLQNKLWDDHIEDASWLKLCHSAAANQWCIMFSYYLTDPTTFKPSQIAQLRGLTNDLGLNPASLTGMPTGDDEEEEDEYFGE